MRVLIVTKYAGSFPFVEELILNLKAENIEALVLDMVDMCTVDVINNSSRPHISNKIIARLFSIPKIGLLLKIIFYKFYLRKFYGHFQHVDIHFASSFYNYFLTALKKTAKTSSVVIWGSDFYRINNKQKAKLNYLFRGIDSIIITNPQMREDFLEYFWEYENKIRIIGFGIKKLDMLKSLNSAGRISKIKESWGIPNDRIVITCGYNGIPQQQHSLIINSISSLPEKQKVNLFLIFPCTYGGNEKYLSKIREELSLSGIPHLIIDKYMEDSDICDLRIVTDITINAQTSDALSASLQEHLMCNNILLAGEWLPYNYFAEIGVKFFTFSEKNLSQILNDCLINFAQIELDIRSNSEIIYDLSSWGSRIPRWISLYKNG